MLRAIFKDQIALGMAQAGVVAIVALAIALVARRRGIHLLGETAVSLGRGIAQIIVVGLILAAMLRGPWWTSPFLLAGMIVAAGATSARRASKVPGALRVSLYAIGLGAGSVIALMTLLGVIDLSVRSLIPVGSMLIANAMNGNALALERFRS